MASKCRPDRIYRAGDQHPQIAGKFTDDDGAFDLTGYTVRMFLVRDPNYQDILIKDAVIADPTSGAFVFTFDATDLICGECQELIIRLINPGGEAVSARTFHITVLRDPANP